ncbi:MAG TPA: hypothetical protein VFB80_22615, partial [Pirellulaceae bacterium]|nr:hypothetical protein [Pirellulaceae bacterium]
MPDHFDPYYTWLGIPPDEQPADHYRLLGVRPFESNDEVIVNAGDQRMAYLRTLQVGKRSKESQALLNEISAAQGCLLDPKRKQAYDAELRRKRGPQRPAADSTPVVPVEARRQARPIAAPLHATPAPVTPLQPVIVQPAQPAQPVVISPEPRPLVDTSAGPVVTRRPASVPKSSSPISLPILIGVGAAAAGLVVFLVVVVWAATRPAPRPVFVSPAPRTNSPAPSPAPAPSPPQITKTPPETPSPSPSPAPAPNVAAGTGLPLGPEVILNTLPLSAPSDLRIALHPKGPAVYQFAPAASELTRVDFSRASPPSKITAVHGFALSDDGSRVAMYSDNRLHVRAPDNKMALVARATAGGRVKSIALNADKRLLAAAVDGDQPLLVVELASGNSRPEFTTKLTSVDWVGIQGDHLCCWSPSGEGEIISLRDPSQRRPLADRTEFAPAGFTAQFGLMTFNRVHPAHVSFFYVRPETGQRWAEFHVDEFADRAQLLAMSPQGDAVVVNHPGRGLAVVQLPSKRVLTRIDWPGGQFHAAALTDKDGLLAVNGAQNRLLLLTMKKLLERPQWQMPATPMAGAREPADGNPAPPADNSAPSAGSSPMPPAQENSSATVDPKEALAALQAAGVRLPSQVNAAMSVRTMGTSFGPQHAPLLASLPRLATLDLNQQQACGEVLQALPSLPALRMLILDNTLVSDGDLVHLAKFPGLHRLSLVRTRLAGPGLENLRHLPELKSLSIPPELPRDVVSLICLAKELDHCSVWPRGMTDADLEYVAGLQNMRTLDLPYANLQGPGLAHLQKLPNLEALLVPSRSPPEVIRQTANLNLKHMTFPLGVGAADVALFARMPRLRSINAPSDFTDQHLQALANFP